MYLEEEKLFENVKATHLNLMLYNNVRVVWGSGSQIPNNAMIWKPIQNNDYVDCYYRILSLKKHKIAIIKLLYPYIFLDLSHFHIIIVFFVLVSLKYEEEKLIHYVD